MDWQYELDRRMVSVSELAEAAEVHESTARQIISGKRQGWPRTRRALVEALLEFKPLEDVMEASA